MPDAPVGRIRGRVLIVAGSDSGGGAGIQADIKAVSALGAYAATAVAALTAQNTRGVFAIHPVPPEFVAQQMRLVLDDIGADCIKLGMLGTPEVIEAVADEIDRVDPAVPLVVDPVMVAKGGARLLDERALGAMKARLLPRATLLTPNLPEAEVLLGIPVRTPEDMWHAADRLLDLGSRAVLLKGGHAPGDVVRDLLVTPQGVQALESERVKTVSTHGTGCTLASAIAAGLAQGLTLQAAVHRASAYVHVALLTAPGLGQGHGPLNHLHTVAPFMAEGG